MKLLFAFLLLMSVAFGQTAVEDEKALQLHTAVMEEIKKIAPEMNIDLSAFTKKLNDKFAAHFSQWKEREFAAKFGKNFATELTDEQKKSFDESLEARKEQEFVRFARMGDLADNYSFNSGAVVLTLNRAKLDRYVSQLLSAEKKQFSKLFLLAELNLIGFAWSDLGVENEKSFNDPLMNTWNKWLSSNQPPNVGEIVPCSGACADGFARWLQLPQEENLQVSPEHQDSLWLRVSVNLRKVSYIADIREWTFEWDGTVVLLNANNKMVLGSYTLSPETKTWRNLDQKALNSAIASSIYRSPLEAFTKSVKRTQEAPALNRLSRLGITGHKTLEDIVSLIELLRKEGQSLQLDLRLDNFSSKEAQLLCFYQGEEKTFIDLLSRVKELKSLHSYSVVTEFTGVHHVLKLVAE